MCFRTDVVELRKASYLAGSTVAGLLAVSVATITGPAVNATGGAVPHVILFGVLALGGGTCVVLYGSHTGRSAVVGGALDSVFPAVAAGVQRSIVQRLESLRSAAASVSEIGASIAVPSNPIADPLVFSFALVGGFNVPIALYAAFGDGESELSHAVFYIVPALAYLVSTAVF